MGEASGAVDDDDDDGVDRGCLIDHGVGEVEREGETGMVGFFVEVDDGIASTPVVQ